MLLHWTTHEGQNEDDKRRHQEEDFKRELNTRFEKEVPRRFKRLPSRYLKESRGLNKHGSELSLR